VVTEKTKGEKVRIPGNLTDESFMELVKVEGSYVNTNEMLGDLHQLTNTLQEALRRGRNQVTSEVLGVLVDLNGLTVKASRGYIHK
jgi:hypothetical protein